MYSAAMSHSEMVADIPRFKITGFCTRPTSFRRSKFCMLRVPIWITSTSCSRKVSCLRLSLCSVLLGCLCFFVVLWFFLCFCLLLFCLVFGFVCGLFVLLCFLWFFVF